VRLRAGASFRAVQRLTEDLDLNTVCREARCPNIFECWEEHGTATFMILGDRCTRGCGFCAVTTGPPPRSADPDEPRRVAEAVARMGLRHAVVTSVTRDDLPDGGAAHFAAVIRAITARNPGCAVEVLTPDFSRDPGRALDLVLAACPAVFSHNLETVPALYPQVRPGSRFEHSLDLLRRASHRKAEFGGHTKTALMLGLGETDAEVRETVARIRDAGVDVLALGQYLQPTPDNLPVQRWISPEAFTTLRDQALALGFLHVEAGPLVRSSYHADAHAPAALHR
jgi:lipoic acid synthetase